MINNIQRTIGRMIDFYYLLWAWRVLTCNFKRLLNMIQGYTMYNLFHPYALEHRVVWLLIISKLWYGWLISVYYKYLVHSLDQILSIYISRCFLVRYEYNERLFFLNSEHCFVWLITVSELLGVRLILLYF